MTDNFLHVVIDTDLGSDDYGANPLFIKTP